MLSKLFLALALLGAPLGYAAPLASPYSISIYPAQTFTASGQTGTPIQLNGLTVLSTVGSSFASGTITVTGTSLTTATFSVQGSSDGGTTYFALPIIDPLAAPSSSAPATTVTVTGNYTYQVSLAGITHIRLVTSGTFTATALSLTLTASPNAQVSRNRGGGSGGSYTLPIAQPSTLGGVKPDNSTITVDPSTGVASVPAAPVFTSGANGLVPASGGGTSNFLRADGSFAPPPGSVASGVQGQPAAYNTAGSALAPLPKFFYLNAGMTLSQINAVFTAADSNSVVIVGQGVPQYNWNNANGAQVKDMRMGSDWLYPAAFNVPCDSHYEFLTISSGANSLTVPSGVAGQTLFIGYQTGLYYQAPQYTWFPTISSMSGSTATLSGHAPFSFSGWVTVGTDATASAQAMLNASSYIFPVRLPTQCRPVVRTLTWPATNFAGQNMITSQFIGVPAQDILSAPNSLATSLGLTVTNTGFALDESIDASLGYVSYDPTGVTPTTVPAVYRPLLVNTQNVNHPLTDQWVTGGSNGVASITAGSAVICVPTALGRTAPNSINIVFPYLPVNQLFQTTVLNQTGTGCPGGNVGVTLNAALPAGTTASQAYWEAGTAFETGETTIPTTINYPLAITVSLPSAPDPQGTMAGHGHVILGNGSVRLEADYLGNNYSATPGSATIVLRRGPGTITSALTAGAYTIIPTNPCPANFEVPPPVFPNINGSSGVTPANAVDTPGGCGGNAAISFPTDDGLTVSTGISSATMRDVVVTSTPNSVQGGNSSIGLLFQGDATGYSSSFKRLNIEGVQFGFAQGPAGKNQWNISAVGPTSSGMSIEDCQIHAAYPLILVGFQDGLISRCDTYTAYLSPYDGSNIGPATAIAMGYTINEQTGGAITITYDNHVEVFTSEPHTGNGQETLAYADIRASNTTFNQVNFEGTFLIFAGTDITVENSQYGLPVINYGYALSFKNTASTSNTFWMTNNWADSSNQFFNWGQNSSCQTRHAAGGPSMNCGVGFYQGWEGHSITGSMNGNNTAPYENELGGQILMSERGNVGPVVFDSSEPYWGAYNTCPGVTFCIYDHLDGPFSALYVGYHNRLSPIKYVLNMNVKTPAGSNTFAVQFVSQDDGSGHCGSTGNFGYVGGNPSTTSWSTVSVPVDLTGKQGCVLSWQTQDYGSVSTFEFGMMNFVPDVNSTNYNVPSDSIYNTACQVPGREYGTSATGYKYVCVAGTIKRFGPAS